MSLNQNKISTNTLPLIMYVDMNSYFASCEQQFVAEYRNKPIGVCPFLSANPAIIAPSKEAKTYGIKTGMRALDAKLLCPDIQLVSARPVIYRRVHVQIMNILRSYCDDVIPKSIDEAVVNFSSYQFVYKDLTSLAIQIKKDIKEQVGEYITCSIGIAANSFLAKLGTELQKPDGLIKITAENIDSYLSTLTLTDLPGIAKANERRLKTIGINTPVEMRQASETLLRKAFGGVVGNYWHCRLHFGEVDMYTSKYKTMSATRSIPSATRSQRSALMSLLISLCTRLEQRMVKQGVFCRSIHFFTKYYNRAGWEIVIPLNQPLQDAMEMMQYITLQTTTYEKQHHLNLFSTDIQRMGVVVSSFVKDTHLQYSLFDNTLQKNLLRKTVYQIKDRFGKNSVRKASEVLQTGTMRDAIGFGSVKDLYKHDIELENGFNKYLLEEDPEEE